MSDRRVITRQREKNEARRRQLTRRMNVSAVVQRLINPLTSYKINDYCYIDEDLMKPNIENYNSCGAVFNWNRINDGMLCLSYVRFTMDPIKRQTQIPPQYVVQRFKSYGKQQYYNFAEAIQKILKTDEHSPIKQADFFITTEQLLKQLEGTEYIIYGGQFSPRGPKNSEIYVSKALCDRLNIQVEAMMLDSVKFGRLSLRYFGDQSSFLSDTGYFCEKFLSYLNLLSTFRSMAIRGDIEGIKQLSSAARVHQIMSFSASGKGYTKFSDEIHGQCELEVWFPSPIHVVLILKSVKDTIQDPLSTSSSQPYTNEMQIEDSELMQMQNIVSVPRELMHKYRKRICRFRQL